MDSRHIIQDTIADMDHDPAAEAEVIDAFTGAGLLWQAAGDFFAPTPWCLQAVAA